MEGGDSSGNSTSLKTPQDDPEEGRLKPFFANNVDIPFARARRLKPSRGKRPPAVEFNGFLHIPKYLDWKELLGHCTSTSCTSKLDVANFVTNKIARLCFYTCIVKTKCPPVNTENTLFLFTLCASHHPVLHNFSIQLLDVRSIVTKL